MTSSTILRQVALVSYGTKFLRGEIALAAFAQHGLFARASSQFRDGTGQPLLTDDFRQWLEMQRDAGAQRLSLHLLASLPIGVAADARRRELAVLVHFTDHHQAWLCRCDDAALDLYSSMEPTAGSVAVPLTNWTALLAAIREDLNIPTDCPPNKPFFAPWWEQPETSKMPVIPFASGLYLPHQLMEMLCKHDDQMKNLMTSKNENSYYQHLSEEAASEVDYWAARLSCWILEVRLRGANEYRLADVIADDPPLVRLVEPPPPPPPPRQKRVQSKRQKKTAAPATLESATSTAASAAPGRVTFPAPPAPPRCVASPVAPALPKTAAPKGTRAPDAVSPPVHRSTLLRLLDWLFRAGDKKT